MLCLGYDAFFSYFFLISAARVEYKQMKTPVVGHVPAPTSYSYKSKVLAIMIRSEPLSVVFILERKHVIVLNFMEIS